MSLIINAAHYARNAHKFQRRKYTGDPYILHCGRVAARVTLLPDATGEMVAAAWLHDVIEDTTVTDQNVLDAFGLAVADLVVQLTNPSKQYPQMSRSDRKQMDRDYLSQVTIAAKQIKLYDRIDNIREMYPADDEFKHVYIEESRLLADALLDDTNSTLCTELMGECRKLADSIVCQP